MKNQNNKLPGCLSGCLVFICCFPLCFYCSVWFAFAIGPMSCALPNRCSQSEINTKSILSLLVLFGGGFAVPIIVASSFGKVTSTLIEKTQQSKDEDDSDMP
ncbi:hypothetical protein [Dolichospermum sp. UHCC 0259]|uniref:hypothetical protein n=1 Tax=Dolichospermum sp. UHCC 0259 TaxID=2590010 RepID=UPI001580D816|nr:hypothetical protein [Dolichospermum sp. UHCC 0259]